ncbi:hypothetical protein B0H13DRAFT_2568015 [Mycena leptocephala]|nr:hypothetical protein B0H13DRAFT_2568015 [Mycena leptocephala]
MSRIAFFWRTVQLGCDRLEVDSSRLESINRLRRLKSGVAATLYPSEVNPTSIEPVYIARSLKNAHLKNSDSIDLSRLESTSSDLEGQSRVESSRTLFEVDFRRTRRARHAPYGCSPRGARRHAAQEVSIPATHARACARIRADGTLANRPAARGCLRDATAPAPPLPANTTTAASAVLPRPARALTPHRRCILLHRAPGQYAPQPQPQTHHRSRSSSYALPPAQQMGMPMPMPQPGPGQPVRTRSYSFQAAAPPPQPVRASTYPYPAPPPGSGQKGYVYHPSPGYAPPGPSPGYSSAPALQMHPALFNQPQRSPTKEVPLLKRVFGFGGGGGRGRGVRKYEGEQQGSEWEGEQGEWEQEGEQGWEWEGKEHESGEDVLRCVAQCQLYLDRHVGIAPPIPATSTSTSPLPATPRTPTRHATPHHPRIPVSRTASYIDTV